MSYSSEQTRARILSSAKDEFLRLGFIGANLREISNRANVTTGALYTHFDGKEDLFSALVNGPATEFIERFVRAHRQVEEGPEEDVEAASSAETDWALDFIYDHSDAFKLIVMKSEGTKYARYIDSLIEIEETTQQRVLPPEVIDSVGTFFIHVVASSGIREMFDPLTHGLSRNEARAYMQKVKEFRFSGWNAVVDSRRNEE